MSFARVNIRLATTAGMKTLPEQAQKLATPGCGMQIRRFSKTSGLVESHGTRQPASAAAQARRARSLSTRALIVPGGSGSQGAVAVYGAALNFGKTHDHKIFVPARDPEKAEAETRVVGKDGKSQLLAEMPGVKFGKTVADSGVAPSEMNVLITVPSSALQGVLRSLLSGTWSVAATYNGTPPVMDVADPDHGISMLTSGLAPDSKQGFVYGDGGFITFAHDLPQLNELQILFDGGAVIQIRTTQDIRTDQWAKIALNTALNSLATIFGMTLGDITEHMAKNPEFNALVRGLVQEVCTVATFNSAKPVVEPIMQSIRVVGEKSPKHRTSMGNAFAQGKPLEVDVLSGGVAALGQAKGVKTPLCSQATLAIKTMEQLRGKGPVPPDFEQTHATVLPRLRQDLQAAATSEA